MLTCSAQRLHKSIFQLYVAHMFGPELHTSCWVAISKLQPNFGITVLGSIPGWPSFWKTPCTVLGMAEDSRYQDKLYGPEPPTQPWQCKTCVGPDGRSFRNGAYEACCKKCKLGKGLVFKKEQTAGAKGVDPSQPAQHSRRHYEPFMGPLGFGYGGNTPPTGASPWRNDADAKTIADLQRKLTELEKGGAAEVAMEVDGVAIGDDTEDRATAALDKQLQYLGEKIAIAKKFDDEAAVTELEAKQKELREQKAKARPPRARAHIAERKLRTAEGKLHRARARVEETAHDLDEAQKAAEAAKVHATKLADEVAALQLEHYTASLEAMAGKPMLAGGGCGVELVLTAEDFTEPSLKAQLEDPTLQPFLQAIKQKYQAALAAQTKAREAGPDGQGRMALYPTPSLGGKGTEGERSSAAGGAAADDSDDLDEEHFKTVVDTDLLAEVAAAGTEDAQRKLLFDAMRSKAVARRPSPYS